MSPKSTVHESYFKATLRLMLQRCKLALRLHTLVILVATCMAFYLFVVVVGTVNSFENYDRFLPVRIEKLRNSVLGSPPNALRKSARLTQNISPVVLHVQNEDAFNETAPTPIHVPVKWIHFVEKLHKQPNGPNYKRLLAYVKNVAMRKWVQNVSNRDMFRRSLRAELGKEGCIESFLLTKKNTEPEAKINYYMTGTYENTTWEFWENLPQDTPFTRGRYKTCSIIGSSGIVKDSGCGSKIDSADYVIRFNLANVKGYEKDVGSITNFTTLNPSFIVFKLKYLKAQEHIDKFESTMSEFKGSHLWLPAFGVDWSFKAIMDGAKRARKYAKIIIGNPEHIKRPTELWANTMKLKMEKRWLSSGFYMIFTFMDVCDQINVFGFWPFKTTVDGKPVPFHYFKDKGKAIGHSFDLEYKSLVSLHEYGIINMHFGKCT